MVRSPTSVGVIYSGGTLCVRGKPRVCGDVDYDLCMYGIVAPEMKFASFEHRNATVSAMSWGEVVGRLCHAGP